MRRVLIAIFMTLVLVGTAVVVAPPADGANPVEVKYLGRDCRPNGDTRVGVKLINDSNKDKRPSWWYNYTDTGFGMGYTDLLANTKEKIWVKIPAGREIDYFAVYRSETSETPIWSREGIKALDCTDEDLG